MSIPQPINSVYLIVRSGLLAMLLCTALLSHGNPQPTPCDNNKPNMGRLWVTVAELQAPRMPQDTLAQLRRWASEPAPPVLAVPRLLSSLVRLSVLCLRAQPIAVTFYARLLTSDVVIRRVCRR